MEIEQNVARGMDPVEARLAATRSFGGVARVKEDVRVHRGLALLDGLAQDLRTALRARKRSPGFTLVAISTLALGVGANTAILSVVEEVLLRPVPYADASRVVVLERQASPSGGELNALSFSTPELEAFRQSSRSFETIVEYHSMPFTLLEEDVPERVDTGVVSADFFSVLGSAARPGPPLPSGRRRGRGRAGPGPQPRVLGAALPGKPACRRPTRRDERPSASHRRSPPAAPEVPAIERRLHAGFFVSLPVRSRYRDEPLFEDGGSSGEAASGSDVRERFLGAR